MRAVLPFLLSGLSGVGLMLIFRSLTGAGRGRARRPSPGVAGRRRLARFLVRAGVRDVTTREFVGFSALWGVAGGLLAQIFLGWGLVSLGVLVICAAAPTIYWVQKGDRKRAAIQAGLAEAMGQLRDAIRAGLGVQEALAGLAQSGPEVLQPEFRRLLRDTRLRGFAPALLALQDRLADPLADTVVVALLTTDQLGGKNLSDVLDRLVEATRGELRVQEESRAMQVRQVTQARLIAAMPFLVLVAIRKVNPSYLAPFDGGGQLILAGCLLWLAIGYAWMSRLGRIPGDERVLRT